MKWSEFISKCIPSSSLKLYYDNVQIDVFLEEINQGMINDYIYVNFKGESIGSAALNNSFVQSVNNIDVPERRLNCDMIINHRSNRPYIEFSGNKIYCSVDYINIEMNNTEMILNNFSPPFPFSGESKCRVSFTVYKDDFNNYEKIICNKKEIENQKFTRFDILDF